MFAYKNYKVLAMYTVATLSMVATTAQAEIKRPNISGAISFEIQNDGLYDTDDATGNSNVTYSTIEPYVKIALTDALAIESSMVFEQVQDPLAGEDSYFENEGMYIEELKLTYGWDRYNVYAGKFNPAFGTAWDLAPGIWGVDFTEDYEVTEKIGLGGDVSFKSSEQSTHVLSFASYFADTTFLSESTITHRGDLQKSDGGVSNTEDLSSFAIALDGENLFNVDGLNYHTGFRFQSEGDADVGLDDETGYVVGLNYDRALSDDYSLDLIGEYATIQDIDGSNDDMDYITVGSTVTWKEKANFALSYTDRTQNVSAGADVEDWLFQASTGYAFDNGIALDVGYRGSEETGQRYNVLGVLLSYSYEFDF